MVLPLEDLTSFFSLYIYFSEFESFVASIDYHVLATILHRNVCTWLQLVRTAFQRSWTMVRLLYGMFQGLRPISSV